MRKGYDNMKNKVVLVTGSSRGIGAATIIQFASKGYNVVIDYRDNDTAGESISKLGSTEVTNKGYIEKTDISAFIDNDDKTGTAQKSLNSTYFDDNFFDYILNMSIPTRC